MTHGGVALGPKPRSYNYHINNKVKRLALLSVLSDKAANGNMVVVDKFTCDEYKTKAVVAMLNAVGAGKKNLLVNETVDAKFVKSAGNIAGVKTTFAGSVNTYDVLNADKLIISVDAAKKLGQRSTQIWHFFPNRYMEYSLTCHNKHYLWDILT